MDWTDGGKCLPSDNKEQRAESARIQQTLARVITIQQAQFALLDELAQVVLDACLNHRQPGRSKLRRSPRSVTSVCYITMAALHMQGNARQMLEELVGHDQ